LLHGAFRAGRNGAAPSHLRSRSRAKKGEPRSLRTGRNRNRLSLRDQFAEVAEDRREPVLSIVPAASPGERADDLQVPALKPLEEGAVAENSTLRQALMRHPRRFVELVGTMALPRADLVIRLMRGR
jgi:hypothetical protein